MWHGQYLGDPYRLYRGIPDTRIRGASHEEIAALDWLLERLPRLEQDERRILVARSMGWSWRKIKAIRKARRERPNHNEALLGIYERGVRKLRNADDFVTPANPLKGLTTSFVRA